jgi:D-3-phosphoglycerate dehydrogenase
MVDSTLENLVLDPLEWLARRERIYEEAINVWRTPCPKLLMWEEAGDRGLVTREVRNGSSIVRITLRGMELLQQRRPFPRFEDGMEKAI